MEMEKWVEQTEVVKKRDYDKLKASRDKLKDTLQKVYEWVEKPVMPCYELEEMMKQALKEAEKLC